MRKIILMQFVIMKISCMAQTVVTGTLDVNNVKTIIKNSGDMGGYEVPKGSNRTSIFASSLWIGGLDNAGQLHTAAQTYRQAGTDYWPGPLDTLSATTNSTVVQQYNKIWKIDYTDINDFITNFNNGNVQNGTYIPTQAILTWPAHGSGNYTKTMAPFIDYNGDGIYDPYAGDYPKIKGDQALYFIFNDNYATHGETKGLPLGIEVHGMAYAYGTCQASIANNPELNFTTFYDYKIINRSSNNYNSVYVGFWSDVEVGCYKNDYVGCNVQDNYGFCYNGTPFDSTCGSPGYGSYPPAQGYAILKGPQANANDGIDNNNNGIIDETGEDCRLNKLMTYNNNIGFFAPSMTNPNNKHQFYNYMTGRWKDSTFMTCGGNGYGGTVPTDFYCPGDVNSTISTDPSNACGNWIDASTPLDRRLIISSGPFDLNVGQSQSVEYALVTSFDSSAVNPHLMSVAKLKSDVKKIQTFYDLINKPNCYQALIGVGLKEQSVNLNFNVYPNPAQNSLKIKLMQSPGSEFVYEIVDLIGKSVVNKTVKTVDEFEIDLSATAPGVYFLKITTAGQTMVKKFIKE